MRNWATTIPTVLVIAIVLILFHRLLLTHLQANEALKNIQQKFSITIYLKDDADPFAVGNLITSLEERSYVIKPVTYTSKEEAWKIMSKAFSLDSDLMQKYQFSLPASLTITPKDPSDTPKIQTFLENNARQLLKEPLDSKTKQKSIAEQMMDFINNVRNSTLKTILLFIVLFLVSGSLLISFSIHLAVNSRHREISIMKLVGASYQKIIIPFVLEGVEIGIIAYAIFLLVMLLSPETTLLAEKPSLNAFLLEFVIVVALSGIASYLTTLFHIRKKTLI